MKNGEPVVNMRSARQPPKPQTITFKKMGKSLGGGVQKNGKCVVRGPGVGKADAD